MKFKSELTTPITISGMVKKRRIIYKSVVKRRLSDGRTKEYPQYKISLPRRFVEQHGKNVVLIVGSVGFIIPSDNEKAFLTILQRFPEICRFVSTH